MRKLLVIAVVTLGVACTGMTAASARPVSDPPVYNGPAYGTSSWFAGRHAVGCVGYGVFRLDECK